MIFHRGSNLVYLIKFSAVSTSMLVSLSGPYNIQHKKTQKARRMIDDIREHTLTGYKSVCGGSSLKFPLGWWVVG